VPVVEMCVLLESAKREITQSITPQLICCECLS